MKDYKEISGLDIKLESTGLVYDQNQFPVEENVRNYSEAREVYLEKSAEEQELYWMYRYLEKVSDADMFTQFDVEYDVTMIKPGKVGAEPIKTIGHYHGLVPGTQITYPEVYEVLDGKTDYLLQSRPDAEGFVDVVFVVARVGDKVVVPPDYGHISMNLGDDYSLETNLQKRDLPASADYGSYKELGGAALFCLGGLWQENPKYKIRSTKKVRPLEKPEWGLEKATPLYTAFITSPEKFKFLTEPQNYDFSDVWEEI